VQDRQQLGNQVGHLSIVPAPAPPITMAVLVV
jgi:hypothetical protein